MVEGIYGVAGENYMRIRKFKTGATRDAEMDKLDPWGLLCPNTRI
jgi:hypothetical protein